MTRRERIQARGIGASARLTATSWLVLAAVTACGSTHIERNPPAQPAATDSPATLLQPTEPAPQTQAPVQGSADGRMSAAAALPPCVPTTSKPTRSHDRKSTETPQRPEAPATPVPGAVINAQVRQLDRPLASILGKPVHGPKGEDFGRVVDVLADADGHVRVAIIEFGGFLGVGTRRVAVEWPLLRFNPSARDDSLTLSVSREELQSTPTYKEANTPAVLMPPPGAMPDHAAGTGQTPK
jgi:hypothetical protein